MRHWRLFVVFSPLVLILAYYALAKIPIDDLQPFRKYRLNEDVKYWTAGAPPFTTQAPMEVAQINVADAPADLVDRFRRSIDGKGWKESRSTSPSGIQFEQGSLTYGGWISIEPIIRRDGSTNWQSFRVIEFRSLSSFQIWLLRLRTWRWDPIDNYQPR